MSMKHFLQRRLVPFEVISHPKAYDAQHLAEALHTPGREVAKTVLLRATEEGQQRYVVAVLPATRIIDFEKLKAVLDVSTLELATEVEIAKQCPDCEFGVLPPFGMHYGAQTLVDSSLAEDEYIAFESDSYTEAIRMKYEDFCHYERPLVAEFSQPR